MTDNGQKQLGKTLWAIADRLRGSMNADDFHDYMLSFLFLRYLSDNYEAAAKKELGGAYPDPDANGNGGKTPLSVWYAANADEVSAFERTMATITASGWLGGVGQVVPPPWCGARQVSLQRQLHLSLGAFGMVANRVPAITHMAP